MASTAPLGPFILQVRFEHRGDGGLRASCDKVPGFRLSHSDPDAVLADVEPALALILTQMFAHPMRVERAYDADEIGDRLPPRRGEQSYIGQRVAA